MLYALIKTESAALGRVMNVILADAEFIETIQADWDHIEALDTLHEQGLGAGIGWCYDLATGEFIDPTPPAEPDQRPQIVVVGITADAAHAANRVRNIKPSPPRRLSRRYSAIASMLRLLAPPKCRPARWQAAR